MKIGRFRNLNGKNRTEIFYGLLIEDGLVLKLPEETDPFQFEINNTADFISNIENVNGKEYFSMPELEVMVPVVPTKIVAVGLNYRDHAAEMNKKLPDEPLLFIKPSTSVIPHLGCIVLPDMSERVDYESEMAVVIGKKAKNIDRTEADDYIMGYTCMNDVTARDLQSRDIQYTRAKGFDTFAPLGPFIETDIKDTSSLSIKGYHNGLLVQESSTANLIFDVKFLVEFISRIMTLLPGDIVSTGTPSGIGTLKKGDKFEIEIENIGRLVNFVC